eukprot:gene36426-41220_t
MKPRTGDGPLEVTKEGRGIVMRVPLEGGGRLVVELNAEEAGSLAEALQNVVGQVSPPEFAISGLRPHAILGVDVVAVPVLPADDGGSVLLGPGAVELGEALDLDLLGVLEVSRATGA